jgi:DNA-binding HxlR family transcriptional regulator
MSDTPRTVRARPSFDHCSIAGALDALGDDWSVLVLRELFFGVHRFNEIQQDLGISRSVLTERLGRLVDQGVVRAVPYREPGQRERHEYRLTRSGVGLLPVMVALMQWGDQYVNDGHGPVELRHRGTDELVGVELRTSSGRPVEPNEIEPREL